MIIESEENENLCSNDLLVLQQLDRYLYSSLGACECCLKKLYHPLQPTVWILQAQCAGKREKEGACFESEYHGHTHTTAASSCSVC
jgi:hypothetical protein